MWSEKVQTETIREIDLNKKRIRHLRIMAKELFDEYRGNYKDFFENDDFWESLQCVDPKQKDTYEYIFLEKIIDRKDPLTNPIDLINLESTIVTAYQGAGKQGLVDLSKTISKHIVEGEICNVPRNLNTSSGSWFF